MILYHGGIVAVDSPAIIKSNLGRDFGAAFYTTDIAGQAERWAARRARFAGKGGNTGVNAIVSVYEYDDAAARAALRVIDFPEASMEWLDMVVKCRSDISFRHGHDIVTGKIANDSVGETISYVVAGVMPKELALEKLKFQKINNQLAFCSPDSLRYLKFKTSYIVGAKK